MKILASPFESVRDASKPDAAELVREERVANEIAVTAPAATNDVRPGLDPSARESLLKLSLLIRDSTDESERNAKSDLDDKESDESESLPQRSVVSPKGQVALEDKTKESFPAVLRLEEALMQVAKKRGTKIYSQQKSKDAVDLILGELERRKPEAA